MKRASVAKNQAANRLPIRGGRQACPLDTLPAAGPGELRERVAYLEAQLGNRSDQLAALTTELILTEDRERRAMARDLHDDLGQVMAILKIKLTALYAGKDLPKVIAELKEIESLIDIANKSVRSLALQLSPPVLHSQGLVAALEWLAKEMERVYGLRVRINDDGEVKTLDEKQRITFFRAARELLVNVAKHARIDNATVTILSGNGNLTLAVSDSGDGFDQETLFAPRVHGPGLGLIGVKERIAFIGGSMHVDSTPGDGSTITLTAPL